MHIRVRRSAAALAAALALALLPGATAVGDSAGGSPGTAGAGSGARAGAAAGADTSAGAEPADAASYIAENLRQNPVWISDQVPREMPRSAASLFTRAAERTGVPTYVVVTARNRLPAEASEEFLDEVHERLGRDGLYVLFEDSDSDGTVRVHGLDGLTAEAAEEAMLAAYLEMPRDAGPVETFERFTGILESGRARERAEAARSAPDPDPMYLSPEDMEVRGFAAGTLVTGVPLLGLAVLAFMRRRRGAVRPASKRRTALVLLGTAGAAGAVAAGSWLLLGTPPPLPVAQPTGPEMAARVERVVEGLERSPMYVDPETADVLTTGERALLRERIARMDVPVLVAAVPMQSADESAGSAEVLAHSLYGRVGRDAVYVIADTLDGTVDIASFGVGRRMLDSYYLPGSAREFRSPGKDIELAGTLEEVLQYVETTPEGEPYGFYPPTPPLSPADEDALPPLFAAPFWISAVFSGPLAALTGFGVFAGALALLGRQGHGSTTHIRYPYARNRPSGGLLRRTARRDTALLARLLEGRAVSRSPEDDPSAVRARHFHRLATGLLGLRGDGGAGPMELLCAAVLARAGKATLEGDPRVTAKTGEKGGGKDAGSSGEAEQKYAPCRLNPLHGPASASGKVPAPGKNKRSVRVCTACATSLKTSASNGPHLTLHLPLGPGRRLVPHQELPGPFSWPGATVRTDAVEKWAEERLRAAGQAPAEPGAPPVDLRK